MDAGELVSDEIVNAIVAERIDAAGLRQGLHPRRLSAHAGAGRRGRGDAGRNGLELDAVIELKVDDDIWSLRRPLHLRQCGAGYHDSKQPPGRRRVRQAARQSADGRFERCGLLQAYYKKTSPLIGYYYAKGKLEGVDGMADIDDGDRRRSKRCSRRTPTGNAEKVDD